MSAAAPVKVPAPADDAGRVGTLTTAATLQAHSRRVMRWRPWEIAVWALIWAAPFVLPRHAALINEIAILALFAVSLDLVLGYAGIVSLGHAAFFGVGAYGAALFAKHVGTDPLTGLAVGTALGALLGALTSPMIVRGSDLTRLMVTLGVALVLLELANKFDGLTGGADGLQGVLMGPIVVPLVGRFEFDLAARTASVYSLAVLFIVFVVLRRGVHTPFGISLRALRDNRLRVAAIGLSVQGRLAVIYTLAAALAGAAGALLAQTTGFASLDVFEFHRSADVLLALVIGGAGWLWGGLIGAIAFKLMHDLISAWTAQYWNFWIGLILVLLMLVGRERLFSPRRWFGSGGRS
jgi:branched-chain amino acid transport system permease protein